MPATPLRRDIQGLRGVAVLAVVLYHASVPLAQGGFIGVDVFFVISGYLITRLLVEELETSGRVDMGRFLARRALRLLPAALVTVLAVAIFSLWYYPPLERDAILGAARAASVYVANLWFTLQAVDYLGGHAASNPMLHMWSLGVEEQFYVFWPLALALTAACWPGAAVRTRVTIMVGLLAAVSLTACVLLTAKSQPWAFFGMPTRAWEFALGALVCLHARRWRAMSPSAANALAAVGLLAVFTAVPVLSDRLAFPGAWALLPAGASALLLVGLEGSDEGRTARLLGHAALARFGDVSYAWYLVHWPVLALTAAWTPRPGPWGIALAVGLSWGLALALHRFVEQPFRSDRAKGVATKKLLAAALLSTLVVAALLTILRRHQAPVPLDPAQARYAAARADLASVYAQGCHVDFPATQAVACEAGAPIGARTMVLLGDSHAAQWFPAFARLAGDSLWRLISYTKSGCPMVSLTVVNASLRRDYVECDQWRADALRRIAEVRPQLVVIGNAAAYGVEPGRWEQGMRATLHALHEAGAGAVVVLRDTPVPGFDVPVCLARAAHRGQAVALACPIDASRALATTAGIADADRRAVLASANARWIDMTEALCPGGHCAPETEQGLVRFSDASHLSARQSEALAESLSRALGDWAPL